MRLWLASASERVSHDLLRLIVAAAVTTTIVGCANGTDSASTADSTVTSITTTTPTSSAAVSTTTTVVSSTTFVVTVKDGKVDPSPSRRSIRKDDTVTIEVTSDVVEEVHVHGYDRSVDLEAGKPGRVVFVADVAGVFEVELEHAHRKLLDLEVR